jgi:hypothetical protein
MLPRIGGVALTPSSASEPYEQLGRRALVPGAAGILQRGLEYAQREPISGPGDRPTSAVHVSRSGVPALRASHP